MQIGVDLDNIQISLNIHAHMKSDEKTIAFKLFEHLFWILQSWGMESSMEAFLSFCLKSFKSFEIFWNESSKVSSELF